MIITYVDHVREEKQIPNQKALLLMDVRAHYAGDVLQPLEDNGVLVMSYQPVPQTTSNHSTSASTKQQRTS